MFSLLQIGINLKREPEIYNILFTTALILLIIEPEQLFNISFQLSYVAVLSIIYLQPKIYGLITIKNKWIDKIWALITVSIAAQIGTLPITLYYFNQISTYFWLSGLIVIPMASVIIVLTMALICLGSLPYVGSGIAYLLIKGVHLMNEGVEWTNTLPYANITNIKWDLEDVVITLILLVVLGIAYECKKGKPLIVALSLTALLIGGQSIKQIKKENQNLIIVYNDRGKTEINLIGNGQNLLIGTGDRQKITQRQQKFWTAEKAVKVKMERGNYFRLKDKTVYLLDYDLIKKDEPIEKIKIDYLILSKKSKSDSQTIGQYIEAKHIIVDSSNGEKEIEKRKKEYANVYIVSEKGAFMERY